MSLGKKVTLWALIPSILILAVSAAITIRRSQEVLQQEIWEEAERLANTLAISITDALRREARDDLPRIVERAGLNPGRFGLAIFDPEGQPILRWGLVDAALTVAPAELAGLVSRPRGAGGIATRGDLSLRSHFVALASEGRILGGLKVFSSMREMERLVARERDYLLSMLLLTSVVLTAVIAVAIRRTVTLPLAGLMEQIAALGSGRPVPDTPVAGRDEVARLSREFNALAQTLQEAKRQLVQESEHAQSVIRSISDGIIGVDRAYRIRTWNRAMAERYGIAESEVMGRDLFAAFPALEREGLRAELDRLLRGESREFTLRHFDHQTLRRGRVVQNIRGSALRGPTDEVEGAVMAIEDVTERVALEREVQQAEKLAVVGQLAAGIAHQIGTPLNVISGSAEYLMMEWGPDRPRPQELEIIVAQTDRIARLIRQLLNFARPAHLELRPLDLNALLQEALELTEHQIAKGRIEIRTDLFPGLLPIAGDVNQLEQAFLNIIINAWHAMPQGGVLTLRTRPAPAGERLRHVGDAGAPGVEAVIADTGVGISPEHLPRIFDPFFSTKGVGKGTGLGLAISRRIIEDHHGSIDVASEVGRGTAFTIWLPVGERTA
jgi:PAS domain S-box-containing protein